MVDEDEEGSILISSYERVEGAVTNTEPFFPYVTRHFPYISPTFRFCRRGRDATPGDRQGGGAQLAGAHGGRVCGQGGARGARLQRRTLRLGAPIDRNRSANRTDA